MGCPCGSGGAISPSIGDSIQYVPVPIRTDCGLTKSILDTWMTALICIKLQGKFDQANISLTTVNQLLGVIQSALNYPDNYCYFYEQLEYFKNNLLPSIVINVPECFS